MDFGEAIAIAFSLETRDECHFKEPSHGDPDEEPEDIDQDDVNASQENSGGILGDNLGKASHGDEKYLKGTPYPASPTEEEPRSDSKTGKASGTLIHVRGKNYEYVVAAHHLIPGNGSLMGTKSSNIYKFMCAGKTVQGVTQTRKISKNIGYCINGAHNGVWLPGNYAIRDNDNLEAGNTWSVMSPGWQYSYMIATVCTVGNQFHDAHSHYNTAVRQILDKFTIVLFDHIESGCQICKGPDILPPYKIKKVLYLISAWLLQKVLPPRDAWKLPFLTSDKFKDAINDNMRKFLADCTIYDATKSTTDS